MDFGSGHISLFEVLLFYDPDRRWDVGRCLKADWFYSSPRGCDRLFLPGLDEEKVLESGISGKERKERKVDWRLKVDDEGGMLLGAPAFKRFKLT
ncbi:hypothetical protein HK098_002480 [Nowakowskiella sp. JEL0407]|nr:hypothetical protein HK098_002480 [Nowakowskiella sp. JEL0407]